MSILSRVLLSVCVLSLAACDRANPDAPADAMSHPAATPDQATPTLGCQGVAYCAVSCGTDLDCDTSCYERGTAKAKMLTSELVACVQAVCVVAGGGGRCSMYPGDNSTDCQACAYNAVSGWPGGAVCTPADDPECNKCGTQAETCLSDL
jgi:hypothetical protein